MKTKVEINGYEIVIEERDGLISVTATLDEEVVEEFQIEVEEGQGEEGQDDVQGFGEFGQDEEEDFDSEEGDDDDEEDFGQEDEEEDDAEGALESFQSFINKKK